MKNFKKGLRGFEDLALGLIVQRFVSFLNVKLYFSNKRKHTCIYMCSLDGMTLQNPFASLNVTYWGGGNQ